MKMSTEGAPKKDIVKKVKKQKKDNIPEMKTDNIIKTEKMLGETPDNNDVKKKKRKLTTEPDNVTDDAYVAEVSKKIEHTDSADNLQEGPVRDKKKKKKNKSKSMQTESNIEIAEIEDVEDDNAQQVVKMSSKKANKVKHEIVANTEEKPVKKTKKDKKEKTKQLTNEDISDFKTVKAKKSKKDKSKLAENSIKIESSESGQVEIVKVKKKKLSLSVAEELEVMDSSQVKKKKHKKKSENEMDTLLDTKEMAQDFNLTQNHKPKKKKMSEENDKEPLLVECEVEDAANLSKLKKHSKRVQSKCDIEADAGMKKKKKKTKQEKEEQEECPQVDLVFLSEKAGNVNEVNVNKERRKALQMEIDQASQPEKPAKPLSLGQWSTAEFGSAEQQQKFLRLMGGFKKGFQLASVSGGGGNMALGRDAQQQLQQGLLGEFERAHSRRMDSNNKGAGLGFAAPSTKKFSIEANAIRSKRFDD